MILHSAARSHKLPDTATLGVHIHCYLWAYFLFIPPSLHHRTWCKSCPCRLSVKTLLVDDLLAASYSHFTWQFSTLTRAHLPLVRPLSFCSSSSTMTSSLRSSIRVKSSGKSRSIFAQRLCSESLWRDLCTAPQSWTASAPLSTSVNYCNKYSVC